MWFTTKKEMRYYYYIVISIVNDIGNSTSARQIGISKKSQMCWETLALDCFTVPEVPGEESQDVERPQKWYPDTPQLGGLCPPSKASFF